jgi:hypothetical protein
VHQQCIRLQLQPAGLCSSFHLPAARGDAAQAKNTGDLAVFELKSGFARSKGVLVNHLSLVKTYRVAVSGLSIEAGVPGSATSIFAVATNSKAITQVTPPRPVAQHAALLMWAMGCASLCCTSWVTRSWHSVQRSDGVFQKVAGGSRFLHGKAAVILCCAAPAA